MLCQPCSDASTRWLDSRPQDVLPDFSRALRGGVGYDNSVNGARDARSSRHERWRGIVRQNQAAIRSGCAAGNHVEATP